MVGTETLNTDVVRRARVGHGAAACRLVLVVILTLLALPGPVMAQASDLTGILEAGLAVQGKGWSQLANVTEMGQFVLGIIEATMMTAAIAYHPTSRAARRTVSDFQVPRMLFAFSLIGMVVGFLVVHHGYVIGFVVFGLGGLLRFRSDVETTAHTTKYILATLLGLCVGIDLPVMALIITVGAWFILYFMGKAVFLTLDVRFSGETSIKQNMDALLARLGERGFKMISVTKSNFKPTVQIVFSGTNKATHNVLMNEMMDMEADTSKTVVDWHLD